MAKKTVKKSVGNPDLSTTPPDKPETFVTRRGWLLRSIVQQLTAHGFDAKIAQSDERCWRFTIQLSRDGYRVDLPFECSEYCQSASFRSVRTGYPEVTIACISPSVTYKPTGVWSRGEYSVTSGVNVEKIVERFELAFEQHRVADEREREKTARRIALIAEARRINGALGRDVVDVTEGDQPELIIRLRNYQGDKIEMMACLLATDTMLPIVQDSGGSLARLERDVKNLIEKHSKRFTS